jgi:hypothetical protein
MERTLFAGLTQLDPGESLATDNASFQSENPPKIDRLLEIGAVTHRHNAHPAQANPGSAAVPTASAVASGGFIPADTSIYVGFTLLDFDGGETVLSPVTAIATDVAIESPDDVPDVAIDYTGGGLVADTYYYGISLLDAEGGETPVGPVAAIEREPGYASGRVLVSGLAAPVAAASAAAWRLWRAVGGGDLFYIASGVADTFTDDGSECVDCTLGPVDPGANLTNGDNSILVTVPSGGAMATASAFSVYLTTDPSFESDSLAGTYPIASAGQILTFRDLIVEAHRPPDVSTCIPGASKIDPDTELLDWHWKRPVATAADLPLGSATASGDVRVTLDDGVPHRFISGAWGEWAMGGSGGSGGSTAVPIETSWMAEPTSHVPVWQKDGLDVLWLRGYERLSDESLVYDDFSAASGTIGDGYALDGAGNAIPETGSNDTNAIHYIPYVPVWRELFDGYVSRTFTIGVVAHLVRIGVTLGTGRTGLFAWITAAGNLEIATRTVDSEDEADFTVIATDALPAAPVFGDTYNLWFERVGNHLHAVVHQDKSIVAEVEVDIPAPLQADFGAEVALEAGLADRWTANDAWTTTDFQVVYHHHLRELYVDARDDSGNVVTERIFDGVGDQFSNFGGGSEYSAGWADDGTNPASWLRNGQTHEAAFSGRSVKSTGSAPAAFDIILTLEPAAAPVNGDILVPVATGDDDGMELGMVLISTLGVVTWISGRSTDPATKHPYVSWDGISYPVT